ncbi:secretory phospholipase A2 receptor-like [Mustelus asterias]
MFSRFLGEPPFAPKSSGREYFFIKDEMTWGEARDQCRNQYMELLSVSNKEENNIAAKLLSLDEPAWIGLFNEHYAEYSWMWTNGELASFFNWDTFYPMDFTTMSVCVIMVNEFWKDVPCDLNFSFICYSDLLGTSKKPTADTLLTNDALTVVDDEEKPRPFSEKIVPTGESPMTPKSSDRVFFLIKDETTWGEARDQCRNRYMELLSVRNKEENNIASNLLSLNEPAWIGLYNEHYAEYSWMWTNGESASFFNWDTFYPMDFATMSVCVIMANGLWKDVPCDFKFSFICYSE